MKKNPENLETIQAEISRDWTSMLRTEALTGLRDVAAGIRRNDRELVAQLHRDHAADVLTVAGFSKQLKQQPRKDK